MAITKTEVKQIAITAPLTGFVSGAGTVVATDTILEAIEKLDANVTVVSVGAVGDKLFLYYNFK